MRLTEASMAIRPRSAWEALDLGTLLAHRHAGILTLAWATLTLPVFGLLTLLFWEQPSVALLLFWWLKPLYERLPLHILSLAVFGETPDLRQSLRALPRLLRPQWLASLTWRRLSATRSFDLPVQQLEGLAGPARQQRLDVLGLRHRGAARWLTLVGVHLEGALWLGLLALIYFFLPAPLVQSWSWQDLLEADDSWLWLEHLSNLLYALVLIVWEPIYVACGFSLYLNRRTLLEAWDLELAFRRLRTQWLPALLPALLLGVCLLSPGAPGWAADVPPPAPEAPSPQAERATPLARDAAREQIGELLDRPPFANRETVTRWRLAQTPADAQPGALGRLLEHLLRLGQGSERLTLLIEAVLWSAFVLLIGLLLWRRRDWLQAFGKRLPRPRKRRNAPPALLFGLDVAPESLPADVAGEVERLWPAHPREALGLLYRALLSRLLHDYRLPLKASHTEGEVMLALRRLERPELTLYAETLTRHWQRLAYGHQLPEAALGMQLCADWRTLFDGSASR